MAKIDMEHCLEILFITALRNSINNWWNNYPDDEESAQSSGPQDDVERMVAALRAECKEFFDDTNKFKATQDAFTDMLRGFAVRLNALEENMLSLDDSLNRLEKKFNKLKK